MRTVVASHELLPEGLRLETLSVGSGRVSSRVHSRYLRTVSDLPWHGTSVALEVRARRFFCDGPSCERRIFCERLPEVVARARKTNRLEGALLAIVVELGGRAGGGPPPRWASSPAATPCSHEPNAPPRLAPRK